MADDRPNAITSREIAIPPLGLKAILTIPEQASGMIIFAHGSGSGRKSPRNNHVARALQQDGFATLLAARLSMAARWVRAQAGLQSIPIGYFGASTGAGAALVAAARDEPEVAAVVSRGGRPDLAGEWLGKVRAPTLLIVGSLDGQVIDLNKTAFDALSAPKHMTIISGAGHLFEEPGTLEEVIVHASAWFAAHLNQND